MTIQILSESKETYQSLKATYVHYHLSCGKHTIIKTLKYNLDGSFNRVVVLVQNASNKAFKGKVGKGFDSMELALNNYKTPEIKAMIAFNN